MLDQKFPAFLMASLAHQMKLLVLWNRAWILKSEIAEIYQKCKTADDIQHEFDALQEELSDEIEDKMASARQSYS